jgi:cytochrome c peroxidase
MDQGRVHWTANFDEIQDFENDIRNGFGGKGFLTDEQFAATKDPLGGTKAGLNEDLDALAAYVTSLSKKEVSPHKPTTGFSDAALRGLRVFESQNCASCHSGSNMTDSLSGKLHNIGTIKRTSGKRRGEPLQGIDTPTLLGVWNSAPYLHDGSAATLRDVLMSENKSQLHGQTQKLSEQEIKDLVQYLKEL